MFVSEDDYVSLNQTIDYNSSYTAPVTGMYSLNCKGVNSTTAIWYIDSARTIPILASDSLTTVLVHLKAGQTIYTRNSSGTTYIVNGYFS